MPPRPWRAPRASSRGHRPGPAAIGRPGDIPGAVPVGGHGVRGALLSAVDVGPGRGVDHNVRTLGAQACLHRLVIGRKNTISTMYSSAEVAARSRLRLPEGYTATPAPKSPNEIVYDVAIPADAIHGDFVMVQIDAHSDLRDEYEGSPYSHASIARRVLSSTRPSCS